MHTVALGFGVCCSGVTSVLGRLAGGRDDGPG